MTSIASVKSLISPGPHKGKFAPWSHLSGIMSHLNRAFSFIGRDPGPKSLHLDLSQDERIVLFSVGGGSVGRALLDTTLVISASRLPTLARSGLTKNRYCLSDLSTARAHLDAYRGPRHWLSYRVDLLI